MKLLTASTALLCLVVGFLGVTAIYAADEGTAEERYVDSKLEDDKQAIESLCGYVVGETTFARFQEDFTGYFTRNNARDPNAGPGVLLRPLKWKKNVAVPADKSDLAIQMFGKDEVPAELTPYVTGAYLLGHPKPETTALTYDQNPDGFNAIAVLQFKDGVLSMLETPACDE